MDQCPDPACTVVCVLVQLFFCAVLCALVFLLLFAQAFTPCGTSVWVTLAWLCRTSGTLLSCTLCSAAMCCMFHGFTAFDSVLEFVLRSYALRGICFQFVPDRKQRVCRCMHSSTCAPLSQEACSIPACNFLLLPGISGR